MVVAVVVVVLVIVVVYFKGNKLFCLTLGHCRSPLTSTKHVGTTLGV